MTLSLQISVQSYFPIYSTAYFPYEHDSKKVDIAYLDALRLKLLAYKNKSHTYLEGLNQNYTTTVKKMFCEMRKMMGKIRGHTPVYFSTCSLCSHFWDKHLLYSVSNIAKQNFHYSFTPEEIQSESNLAHKWLRQYLNSSSPDLKADALSTINDACMFKEQE